MKRIILGLMILTLVLVVSCTPMEPVAEEVSPEEQELNEMLEELEELDSLSEEDVGFDELEELPLE